MSVMQAADAHRDNPHSAMFTVDVPALQLQLQRARRERRSAHDDAQASAQSMAEVLTGLHRLCQLARARDKAIGGLELSQSSATVVLERLHHLTSTE
jgi:hypothetical protein